MPLARRYNHFWLRNQLDRKFSIALSLSVSTDLTLTLILSIMACRGPSRHASLL
ncbi:hypothetical protein H650_24235 [Enterobacter sp. R4-368]|nr:hypothetical protein H650_24235 [Enterobacter sp. R4-368]